MTRIKNKNKIPLVEPSINDYFVGSKSDNNGKTVNFDFSSVIGIINSDNGYISMHYIFSTVEDASVSGGYINTVGDVTLLSSVTGITINKAEYGEGDLSDILRSAADNKDSIILSLKDSSRENVYLYFRIVTAVENANSFDFTIEAVGTLTSGSLIEGSDYTLGFDAVGAIASTQSDFNEVDTNSSAFILNKPENTGDFNNNGEGADRFVEEQELADVATSNDYNDLDNTPTFSENELLNGDYVHVANYDYFVWADSYVINNTVYGAYVSSNISLTTPSITAGQDRFDIIVLNSNGTFSVIEGTTSATPDIPIGSVDRATQLMITVIRLEGGTTEDGDVVNQILYDENTGIAGGEWDTTVKNTGLSNATVDPYTGLTHINLQAVNDGVELLGSSSINVEDISSITFFVKNKPTVGNDHLFYLFIGISGTVTFNHFAISNSNYGYDSSNTTDWQRITIPSNLISIGFFDKMVFTKSVANDEIYIDAVSVQSGTDLLDGVDIISKTSQLINDGADSTSTYVEHDELGVVATSNDYNDLTNLPTLAPSNAEQNVNADWNSVSGDSEILNKPTIPTVPTLISAFTNDSGYIANSQKEVTAAYTILSTDNNKTIWLNSATAFNVTVDTLPDNFECYFYNIGVGTVTFVSGTGTVDTPDGTGLETDKVATLIKRQSNNDYKLKGELV